MVRVDRVVSVLLQDVRAQLVDEPDPRPSCPVAYTSTPRPSRPMARKRVAQLEPAVAAPRPEGVPGQAFRMHARENG